MRLTQLTDEQRAEIAALSKDLLRDYYHGNRKERRRFILDLKKETANAHNLYVSGTMHDPKNPELKKVVIALWAGRIALTLLDNGEFSYSTDAQKLAHDLDVVEAHEFLKEEYRING